MLIQSMEDGWDSKVNFIDKNDVFVGYDMHQSCCEDAGWFISESPTTPYSYEGNEEYEKQVDGYVFDKEFFKSVGSSDLDCGEQVCFRLTSKDRPDIYLHIYNSHNGYYSHGFEFKDGETEIKSDYL